MTLGKNYQYQTAKHRETKNTDQTEIRKPHRFFRKLNYKTLNGEHRILIAVDRFSKWPTVKTCKSSDTKEVLNFLLQNFDSYGLPEKIRRRLFQKNTCILADLEILKKMIAHRDYIPERER